MDFECLGHDHDDDESGFALAAFVFGEVAGVDAGLIIELERREAFLLSCFFEFAPEGGEELGAVGGGSEAVAFGCSWIGARGWLGVSGFP